MPKHKERKVRRYTGSAIKARVKKGGKVLLSKALNKVGRKQWVPKTHVQQGDNVIVVSGEDKGKTGKVLKVFRKKGKITVEGVNIRKKHQKAMGPGRPGEVIEAEAPIFASKVMHWDESKKKASRVQKKTLDNGKRVRAYQVSGDQID